MALAGCGAGGDQSDAVPRLIINGEAHELDEDSSCSIADDGKLSVDTKSVDYDESNVALRFWATPSESRAEVAIDSEPDASVAQGMADWGEGGTAVFNGGLEAVLDRGVLTLQGTFESKSVDDLQVEVDFAIDCPDAA